MLKEIIEKIYESKERIYLDKDTSRWAIDTDIYNFGSSFGKLIMVFQLKQNVRNNKNSEYWCFYNPDTEKLYSKGLKQGEKVVRYVTRNSLVAKIAPIIKVNVEKGLVYFLKDYVNDSNEFENKGYKVDYLRYVLN